MTDINNMVVLDERTIQEMFAFMGEMRAEREYRDTMIRTQAEQFKAMKEDLEETNRKVDDLMFKFARWESKLGTFFFIASCMWAAFVTFKEQLINFIKG